MCYKVTFRSDYANASECSKVLHSFTEVNNFKFYCIHKYGNGKFNVITYK